jgi:2-desacetyl-2-hydroxyethyl bacteriochlorophyllide A dehydrogenase
MNGKCIVFESIGKAVLKKFKIPKLKPGEVLLENDYTVISAGTERANLMQLPHTSTSDGSTWIPGYSGSGRIIAVGENVPDLKLGDRVVISWGGHCSHSIKKANAVLKIEDDSIEMLEAAFTHIASFPLLAVRRLRIKLGESVAIAGMGILGALVLQLANLSGAVPIIVLDLDPLRRELALNLGATYTFSPDEEGFIEKVKDAAGGDGPYKVIEVTGASVALQQALKYIAWKGRIALLGCTRISDAPIDFYKYVHRPGISLIGAHTFARAKKEPVNFMDNVEFLKAEQKDYRTFLKLVSAGKLHIRPLISEIVSPEEAPKVYERLAVNSYPPLGIVFDWKIIR